MNKIKNYIYKVLVDRHPKIKEDYWRFLHQSRDVPLRKFDKLVWLLQRKINKKLPCLALPYPQYKTANLNMNTYIETAKKFDAVSFDLFSTLIFPTVERRAWFDIIGRVADILNFSKMRIEAEAKLIARGNVFPSIIEIYKELQESGCISDALRVRQIEEDCLCRYSAANPFMLEVYRALNEEHKKVIVICDGCYSSALIHKLLQHKGYEDIDKIFVSCETGRGKKDGNVYKLLKEEYRCVVHIGGHYEEDTLSAKKEGLSVMHYPFSEIGAHYRIPELQALPSSIYNSIVNNKLHNGNTEGLSNLYELGYSCWGYLAYGYCKELAELAKEKHVDLILFSSRDTYLFYQVFQKYFREVEAKYVYCSRSAFLRANFTRNFDLYFDTFFNIKAERLTIEDSLKEAGLSLLIPEAKEYGLHTEEILSIDSLGILRKLFVENTKRIEEIYVKEKEGFSRYFLSVANGYHNVCVVDLGWRGTLSVYLERLYKSVGIGVIGSVTGTIADPIPNSLIDRGLLHSYAFSDFHNRDMQVDRNRLLLLETMVSTNTPSLIQYGRDASDNSEFIFDTRYQYCNKHVDDIYAGALDFCEDFHRVAKTIGAIKITGREAFFPLHVMMRDHFDYLVDTLKTAQNTDICGSSEMPLCSLLKK